MQFSLFKAEVAAYVGRSEASLGLRLDNAINRARKTAENRRDFELARVQAKFPSVHYTDGFALSGAVLASDGVTSVSVKTIERVFLADTAGNTFPIGFESRQDHIRPLRQRYEQVSRTSDFKTYDEVVSSRFSLHRIGDTVYVKPADSDALGGTTFDVWADIVRYMPDYVEDTDEDFFLIHGQQFLLCRSLLNLNFYLKEDQRVQISNEELKLAWDELTLWDSQLVESSTDVSLD